MKAGDDVICLTDPDLYGVGKIRGVLENGRLAVEFDGQVDEFGPFELELASVYFEKLRRAA